MYLQCKQGQNQGVTFFMSAFSPADHRGWFLHGLLRPKAATSALIPHCHVTTPLLGGEDATNIYQPGKTKPHEHNIIMHFIKTYKYTYA